ncbi:MAG: hypothetical protein FP816_15280 [Desulfobacteraceae bacterium]|nr:hypothetical protein [Desulfobacteraceae bacterium]
MLKNNASYKVLTILLIILSCLNGPVIANTAESILIKENRETFEITVPVSKLILILPKDGFKSATPKQREGGTKNPRYFKFADSTSGVTLSGWFEHAKRFEGVKKPKPSSLMGIPLLYKNIDFIKIGEWDSVSYDVEFQSNKIPNIKANLVR